jgi:molecular chaperone GrpE
MSAEEHQSKDQESKDTLSNEATPVEATEVEVETEETQQEPEAVSLEDQIKTLEAQLKEEQDNAMRTKAEMVNFRKRQEKERSNWSQMTTKDVISSFLEPLDNLERTVDAAQGELDEQAKSLVEGVKMVVQQINEALDRKNVVSVDPKGELFNPNEHEAYGQIETEDVEEGHVAIVFRKGYKIGDQLIRTATVQVAKKPTPSEEA